MKTEKTILEGIKKIQNPETGFYCGSAVYLRLLPLISLRKEETKEKDSLYPEEEKSLLLLFEKDPVIFSRTKEKDGEKIPWDDRADFFNEQAVFFSEFRNRVESIPFSFRSESRNKILVSSFDILAEEARENLSVFFDYEEASDEFKQAGVSVLREIEGRCLPYPPRKKIKLTEEQVEERKLSALVPAALLWKLIKRKQTGKKPFRSSFEADKKEEEIQNAIRNGIDKKDCLAISDIAKEAGQEILNVGFQQDFLFVSSVLEALSEILPE